MKTKSTGTKRFYIDSDSGQKSPKMQEKWLWEVTETELRNFKTKLSRVLHRKSSEFHGDSRHPDKLKNKTKALDNKVAVNWWNENIKVKQITCTEKKENQ